MMNQSMVFAERGGRYDACLSERFFCDTQIFTRVRDKRNVLLPTEEYLDDKIKED